MITYLGLILFGWMVIFSSVYNPNGSNNIFDLSKNYGKQLVFIAGAFLIAFTIMTVEYRFFYAFSYLIFGFVIIALLVLLAIGGVTKGAQAWFKIGDFKIQPSEFAKFATSLALAKYLSGFNVKLPNRKVFYTCAAIIGGPAILVLLQNDTGTFLVFTSFVLVLYREGISGIWLAIGAAVLIIGIMALLINKMILFILFTTLAIFIIYLSRKNRSAIFFISLLYLGSMALVASTDFIFNKVLQPHQRTRINVLFGKELDIKEKGYQVNQSKLAISSGGFSGKGYLKGSLTKGEYVPEQSTDFIFCTVGEEFGWVGSSILIGGFLFLFFRLINMAERQRSKYNRIYGYCVACILFFHFLINLGMTIGLLPIIGIPLPFISYGGSAMFGFTILLFIFIKLDAHRMQELGS